MPAARPRLAWAAAIVAHAAVLGSVGACNQILGNESTEAITRDGGSETPDAPGAAPDGQTGSTSDATAPCMLGSKRCGDDCIPTDNITTGCGGASCEKCVVPNLDVTGCSPDGFCIGECTGDFYDCDGKPSNGCEVNLTLDASCGLCTGRCAYDEHCGDDGCVGPCDLDGDSYHLCADECTDLESASNCGGCGITCPAPLGGLPAACESGFCGAECPMPNMSACGGQCVAESLTQCGIRCLDCTSFVGPDLHVTSAAACSDGFCELECAGDYTDQDNLPDNGCEEPP